MSLTAPSQSKSSMKCPACSRSLATRPRYTSTTSAVIWPWLAMSCASSSICRVSPHHSCSTITPRLHTAGSPSNTPNPSPAQLEDLNVIFLISIALYGLPDLGTQRRGWQGFNYTPAYWGEHWTAILMVVYPFESKPRLVDIHVSGGLTTPFPPNWRTTPSQKICIKPCL